MSNKLTLGDIAEQRAYERERDEFRARIIELKRRRRVAVGPFVTLVFENRDTMRFQVQEMARAEGLTRDDQIQAELDVYNTLIPEAGQLSATLFIELTSEVALKEWLPRLVGIERSVEVQIGGATDGASEVVGCVPEESHEQQLTRSDVTASVHYIHFELTPQQVESFAGGPVSLALSHPEYQHSVALGEATVAELLTDLRGG